MAPLRWLVQASRSHQDKKHLTRSNWQVSPFHSMRRGLRSVTSHILHKIRKVSPEKTLHAFPSHTSAYHAKSESHQLPYNEDGPGQENSRDHRCGWGFKLHLSERTDQRLCVSRRHLSSSKRHIQYRKNLVRVTDTC